MYQVMNKFCRWTECDRKTLFEGEMELIGKLIINNNTKVGMIPSASKDVYIEFSYQCLHILNNK